jgi:predicted small integral membrane protein
LTVWVVGTVMVAAIFNLLFALADYSPARPGPNPTAGFLLAGFTVCMFVASGVWGAVAPILPPKVAVGGALTTGALLFLAVATLGFLVSR